MSERGEALSSERENSCWRSSFLSLGFTTAIGAYTISKEDARFSPLWFIRGKYLCLLYHMIDFYARYSLR